MRCTDEELNSAEMDQQHPTGTLSKLVIISPPRTGSSMLCRLLLGAGIGVPHEYFNEFHIRHLARRFGIADANNPLALSPKAMQEYLQYIFDFRSRNNVFVTKLQHKQYRLFVENKIASALFSGAKLVYLTRKDVLAQAVSWHFAELTGCWNFEQPTQNLQNHKAAFYDFAAISYCLDEILAEQVLWEYFFHKNRLLPLRISYEDLQDDPLGIVREVAEHAGVSRAHVSLVDDETGPYKSDPSFPSKNEVIAHIRRVWATSAESLTRNAPGMAI